MNKHYKTILVSVVLTCTLNTTQQLDAGPTQTMLRTQLPKLKTQAKAISALLAGLGLTTLVSDHDFAKFTQTHNPLSTPAEQEAFIADIKKALALDIPS